MNRSHEYLIALLMSILILCLLSCAVKNQVMASEEQEVYFDEPHILFLTCSVSAQGNKSVLEVENKILTKGKLKPAHLDNAVPKVGDWVVTVVDAAANVLASTRLDDPLSYRAEYVNDEGVLETKLIERESGVLSVRMPIEEHASLVLIKRKTLDGFDSMFQIETTEL